MKPITLTALAAAACTFALGASPALAGSPDGRIQVKILATGVLPDGKIDKVEKDLIGLPAGSDTKLSDNVVLTLAVEYFATPNVSVETICCFTGHHVTGTGAIAGASLIRKIMVLPATVTAKYHLAGPGGISPYLGAGAAWFIYFNEKPGSDAVALGADKVRLENKPGFVLQGGIDVPINDQGMSLSLDAKRYFVKTTAHFYGGGTEALVTKHTVSPWVLSAGVAYRF